MKVYTHDGGINTAVCMHKKVTVRMSGEERLAKLGGPFFNHIWQEEL